MTQETKNLLLSTPVKIGISVLLGALGYSFVSGWGASAEWTNAKGEINDHEKRITKVEVRQDITDEKMTKYLETQAVILTKLDYLTNSTEKNNKKLDDIITQIK